MTDFPQHSGAADRLCPGRPPAFTLMELLIVVAILGLLIGLVVPSLSRAKLLARVAKAKLELAGVATALMTYSGEQKALPPSRTYCEYGPPGKVHDWAELPRELAKRYYPPGPPGTTMTLNAVDPFNPGRTYKYLHPGKGYHNNAGTYTTIWVPENFPNGDMSSGKDYSNDKDSPVSFVLFSLGTFGDIGYWNALGRHQPCDTQDWYSGNNKGIIVRACMANGDFVMSP
jgi:prepilin-type N-terminal cleavage/methylation domain-containing protein